MKVVPVQEAVGTVLFHDLTQISPENFKGVAYKKGHIIQNEDIPRLLDMGKKHLYVMELKDGLIHENDAALRMAKAAAGRGIVLSEPKEGKVNLTAAETGLLKVNSEVLCRVNEVDQVMFATLHTNQIVNKGKIVAGTRIIPLVIDEKHILAIQQMCENAYPLVEVKPLLALKAGLIITGSEVYSGRIKDSFGPVVRAKLEKLGSTVMGQVYVADNVDMITEAINSFVRSGADLIIVTGGMSVDPDDVTPAGIKAAGGRVVTYGAPTLPGAMFMLAYIDKIPVMGLPGCVMYHKSTIFDLVLPRILAGEEITRRDIIGFGHGGLCVSCPECRFPDCGFGKGD